MGTPQTIGPWEIQDLLHEGHNATVYSALSSARADHGAELIALKVCNARKPVERYQRFLQEVEFLRRTRDPGVLPLVDAYAPTLLKPNERAWLATPLATPLPAALEDAPLEAVVQAIADIAATLARLAARGEHHRDVKPDNLFQLAGRAFIGDFGLVSFPDKPTLTTEGRPLGAIDYMAPEMRTHPATSLGEPADVYGLAKSLWSLATRRVPVPGPIDHPQLALGTLVPHARAYLLDVVIAASTQYDPARRPSLDELARELHAWLTPHQPDGSAPDLDLADALARVSVFVEHDDARYANTDALKDAANRAFNALTPIFHDVIAAFPKLHGSGGFTGDSTMFNWFPQLKSGHGFYRAGGATLRVTSQMPANLIAFFGVEARDDGLIRLVGAYALDTRGRTKRQLLWHNVRDFLPDGPLANDAVQRIGEGLMTALPAAMQAWAQALEEARTE